jgi:hypothetical protein
MKSFSRYILIILFISLLPAFTIAQVKKDTLSDPTGYLSMGARNCFSRFSTNGKAFIGKGAGGQFALRIAKDFNSHWFADWITSNINNLAQRSDFHSGFSMMPQVFSPRLGSRSLALFPLAGICIDYTKFQITTGKNYTSGPTFLERYSFAVQAGCGATLPVSDRLDLSLEAHYMLHIGTDVDIEMSGENVRLIKLKGTNLEGHLVLALSMDFKLFKLWESKK